MLSHQIKDSHKTISSDYPHILIVDDDPDIQASIKDVLELEIYNCTIDLASDTTQAKSLAQQMPPDIALLDIKLGQDSGLDLIPTLKRIREDIACIMMTAYRDDRYTIKAVRFGANDYLFKPVEPVDLIKTVKRLLYSQALKKEIALAEARFRIIFEHAHQWIFLLDNNGRLIDANETALAFIGKPKKSVTDDFFWDTLWWQSSPMAQESIRSGFSKVMTGEIFHAELNIWKNEQDHQTFDLSMKPVADDQTGIHQIIVECWDITDHKKTEEDIKSSNETLESQSP